MCLADMATKVGVATLVKGINDFIFEWQKLGLVADSRQHSAYRRAGGVTEITWGDDGYVLKDDQFASLLEYINLVENRQYSMLLPEGDMFQFSFSVSRDVLVKHRLCWYPCPIKLSPDEVENSSVVEAILERMGRGDIEGFYAKSPVRFDYDPLSVAEDHPEVHLHLISEDCRIPVKSPLCLKKFIQFIMENFYRDLSGLSRLSQNTITWRGRDSLSHAQKSKLHLNEFPELRPQND